MKIVYQVTDEGVRANVMDALEEIEDDNKVIYPDESTRNEIISVCTEYILDAYERNEYYGSVYSPGYYSIVYCTLQDYDCLIEA